MPRLSDIIKERLGECSPAERKVARALLAAYPAAGLETTAKLADRAGVSAPTVLRFASRLGFGSFADFQERLRAELGGREASPASLYDAGGYGSRPSSAAELLHLAGQSLGSAVADTFTDLPPDDLQAGVDLLADPGRRILVAGGRFTGLLGRYLALHLAQLRGNVHPLSEMAVERAATLATAGRKDVLVALDYRRYEPPTLELARYLRDQGARIVLLTDPWLSPIAPIADVVLPSRVGSPSPYDSLVPALAVIETLIAGTLTALGPAGHDHLRRNEEVARAAGLYG
ncbi:MurR/RpiR family transcriptional regulator [Nonomuraea soli]|uniref:DNA-binding MurR/RpiR family transcriptional regulator n=1 Tax=Nonomuraea soli TaxID=1032476 RepID=A0A7W0CFB7_9ACTN|nr:MurR/RpiR family transcriptional regulator [Nonomuraea soli]MBA2890104.1 DNA-binding MurR/RpiR family transcriptional regulator [Nonomuraea soli]